MVARGIKRTSAGDSIQEKERGDFERERQREREREEQNKGRVADSTHGRKIYNPATCLERNF